MAWRLVLFSLRSGVDDRSEEEAVRRVLPRIDVISWWKVVGSRESLDILCGKGPDSLKPAFRPGWVLLLDGDESVDARELEDLLGRPEPPADRWYTLPTRYFWHDGEHVIDGPSWHSAADRPRLIWLAPRKSRAATRRLEALEGCTVHNYSHAITAERMAARAGGESGGVTEIETGDPGPGAANRQPFTINHSGVDPGSWFSPWWRLGLNPRPEFVRRYEGPHPLAITPALPHNRIRDRADPIAESASRERTAVLSPSSSVSVVRHPSSVAGSLVADEPPLLIWEGWLGSEISLGVVADHSIQRLSKLGWEPHFRPIGILGEGISREAILAAQREQQRREALRRHPSTILLKHAQVADWLQVEYPEARIKVGYSYLEAAALDPADVRRANRMDRVLVTSDFTKRVFEASGVSRPISIYGHGYDPAVLQPVDRPERKLFTFLCVAVLNPRKGVDVLLRAFTEEFQRERDVRLVVKTTPHVWHQETHEALLQQYWGHPAIAFLEEYQTPRQMAKLYARADAFVLSTRGEGFGLPILEAMVTGLPVIVTDWGGHLDFCTAENSYLVGVRNRAQLEFALGCEPWLAEPDEGHLREQMRTVYECRSEARERGRWAASDVAGWTWERQASGLNAFLHSLVR